MITDEIIIHRLRKILENRGNIDSQYQLNCGIFFQKDRFGNAPAFYEMTLHKRTFVVYDKSYYIWTWKGKYVCTVDPKEQEEFDEKALEKYYR